MKSSFLPFVVLALSRCAEAGTYQNVASLYGQGFLDAFEWQAIADPTNGRVNYVDQGTAEADGLYSVNGNTVTLRADDWSYLSPSGPGRNSFRLMSYSQYSNHVAMPHACGLCNMAGYLPCLILVGHREVGANWPNEGEIDIVEGINSEPPNLASLHTGPGCTMPSPRWMTGTDMGDNCDTDYANKHTGCGVKLSDGNSFGPNFNNIDGGWYAIERSNAYIAIWFWERGSQSVPNQVQYPGSTVDTSTWGIPSAFFPSTDCNFSSHLGPMNIIINLTFCGDWAGAVYSQDGCPSDCIDYVNNNPGAFSDAYFNFNALNIFE